MGFDLYYPLVWMPLEGEISSWCLARGRHAARGGTIRALGPSTLAHRCGGAVFGLGSIQRPPKTPPQGPSSHLSPDMQPVAQTSVDQGTTGFHKDS